MKSQNINYLPKLDHLRFFAALLVTIYHYYHFKSAHYIPGYDPTDLSSKPTSAFIIEGHTGVSLFLVLSGFIFSAISYGRELDYGRFIQNRLLRIMPLYGSFILLGAFLSAAPLSKLLSSLLFLPPLIPGVEYLRLTPHLWTITLEFQFYLVFPFLVGFLHRYGFKYAVGMTLLLILIRFLFWQAPEDVKGVQGLSTTLFGRLDQFLIGMVFGAIYSGRSEFKHAGIFRSPWCLLISVLLIVGVIYWFHQLGGYRRIGPRHGFWVVFRTLEGLAWGAVVMSYVSMRFDWPARVSRWLAGLGALSYSMYVTHWIFVGDVPFQKWIPQFSSSMTTNAVLTVCLVIMPVIAAVSWLTYHVIEKPFFELRKSYLKDRGHGS